METNVNQVAHLTRQLDIIPVSCLGEKVTVIGAGAIGSLAVLSLAKMGFGNVTVFDDDKVDIENMSCSLYRMQDVGKPKVVALAEIVKESTGVMIEPIQRRYEGGVFPGIVIAAVDSMAARQLVWESHLNRAPTTKVIIDPRMGAENALMYVMNPMSEADAKTYKASLYSDAEAVQERCTAKATIYTANMLAGLVAKAVKDVATGGEYPRTTMWAIAQDEFKAWRSKHELN